MDAEGAIEAGNADQRQDLFLQSGKLHNPSVLSHFSLCNQEGAQTAAITELNLAEVNDEVLGVTIAQDEKLAFQLRRDARVELAFFDLQNGGVTIFLDLELHGILLLPPPAAKLPRTAFNAVPQNISMHFSSFE